jgi:hypothetical protein
MVAPSVVDAHAGRVLQSVALFEAEIGKVADGLVDGATQLLLAPGLKANKLGRLSEVGDALERAVARSNYRPLAVAFAENLVYQLDEFREMFPELVGADGIALDGADFDILTEQVSAAAEALAGFPGRMTSEARQFLAGARDLKAREVVSHLSKIVRKLGQVGTIARDQELIFFRTVGELHHKKMEAWGETIRYAYVGRTTASTRSFCRSLLGERRFSRKDVEELENNQVPGVRFNGGGRNCLHYFVVA